MPASTFLRLVRTTVEAAMSVSSEVLFFNAFSLFLLQFCCQYSVIIHSRTHLYTSNSYYLDMCSHKAWH